MIIRLCSAGRGMLCPLRWAYYPGFVRLPTKADCLPGTVQLFVQMARNDVDGGREVDRARVLAILWRHETRGCDADGLCEGSGACAGDPAGLRALDVWEVGISSACSTYLPTISLTCPSFSSPNSLKRQPDGRFADADLARVLMDATSVPAGSFGARGTPSIMKLNEVMGIEQSRRWGVCSLNDFRKVSGILP